jgi:uncharacterized protein with von Willebrand factor type A (vWA) domain
VSKPFRTIEDVLRSPWAGTHSSEKSAGIDRVLRSTKLEDSIYADVRAEDDFLTQTEQEAKEKLSSFPALSQDIFQSFYSLFPRKQDEEKLSVAARKFNAPILNHIQQSEDFPTLKSICEGRELPAYEAASEFISRTAHELDTLLTDLGGEKGALNTLEKLEEAQAQAQAELEGLLERLHKSKEANPLLEKKIIDTANRAESKQRQVMAVSKLVDASASKNAEKISALVGRAVTSAAEKAEEVQSIIGAWGDDPGDFSQCETNAELLTLIRKSDTLKAISRYLGRFREIFAEGKRNGYAYGRGETYSLESGNNLSRAITSELAMLASKQTLPLFLRKYQAKQLKQYRRREPVYKGMGDIICCLDESTSTIGDPIAWGKAVALTLLEIAADSGRKFALIHFSGPGSFKTDLFLPGKYGLEDKLHAAETVLNGGTDFATPMTEALRLMEQEEFENADIVFLTDGECELSAEYVKALQTHQEERKFTVTGVLLDGGKPGMPFSLESFCQNIYRTSELVGDELLQKIVGQRI